MVNVIVEIIVVDGDTKAEVNTAKTALRIFLDCKAHFNDQIRPLFIARAIQHYTKKKKAPRLVKKRNKINDYDVFVGEV